VGIQKGGGGGGAGGSSRRSSLPWSEAGSGGGARELHPVVESKYGCFSSWRETVSQKKTTVITAATTTTYCCYYCDYCDYYEYYDCYSAILRRIIVICVHY